MSLLFQTEKKKIKCRPCLHVFVSGGESPFPVRYPDEPTRGSRLDRLEQTETGTQTGVYL